MNKITLDILYSLYHQNSNDNFCFSPHSYQEVINSILLICKDKNLQEILNLLQINELDIDNYVNQFKNIQDIENYNSFLLSSEYNGALNKVVAQKLKDLNIDIQNLDFNNTDLVISYLNNLAKEKTHGKITNIINKSDISPLIRFIIINCLYFKKDWLYKFNKLTYTLPFIGTYKQVEIHYLNNRKYCKFYEDAALDIVEIPFKNSSVNCYLFVPIRGLFDIIDKFEHHYKKIDLVKVDCEVDLTVPEFKIESTFDLKEISKLAGINNIFNLSADWKFLNLDLLKRGAVIAVDQIVQKTYLDFSETGMEAAAVTMAKLAMSGCYFNREALPRVKYITANKPFLYVLVDQNNKDTPLFVGTVNQL
jgi:serpin B